MSAEQQKVDRIPKFLVAAFYIAVTLNLILMGLKWLSH